MFLNWTATGTEDDRLSLARLKHLGAGYFRRRWLLRMGREGAKHLVQRLRPQIYGVAAGLREHRQLTQEQIDALFMIGETGPLARYAIDRIAWYDPAGMQFTTPQYSGTRRTKAGRGLAVGQETAADLLVINN